MWTDDLIARLSDQAHQLVLEGVLEPWEAIPTIVGVMRRPCTPEMKAALLNV